MDIFSPSLALGFNPIRFGGGLTTGEGGIAGVPCPQSLMLLWPFGKTMGKSLGSVFLSQLVVAHEWSRFLLCCEVMARLVGRFSSKGRCITTVGEWYKQHWRCGVWAYATPPIST